MPESSAHLPEVATRLRRAREKLARRAAPEVAGAIEEVVDRWLAPGSPWMERAVEELSAAGRFSAPMLRFALPRMIAPLGSGALSDLVERELGGWQGLEKATPPELVLHVLPSNLPGHAAIPSALTLLMRSATLLKPGRDDRVFADLWIESLGAVDADLGASVAAVYWPGADRAATDTALSIADLVVVSGSDRAIEDLASRCSVPLIAHGSRLSFAAVASDRLDATTAQSLAVDVAVWDQLGCLSPQVCFVEGDASAARVFAEAVRDELAKLAVTLPPGPMDLGEILDERRFCDEAAWRGYGSGEVGLYRAGERPGVGSVAIASEPALRPTPLHRCLRVVPLGGFGQLAAIVAPHRRHLEAAGLAVGGDRFAAIAGALHQSGVPHVVELGAMQQPDLTWRQGGRPRIAEWCGIA